MHMTTPPPSRGAALVATAFFAVLTASFIIGAGASSKPADSGLVFDRKPIHPLSVSPLFGDLASEEPVIAAVDLEGSTRSGSHQAKVTVREGTVRADDRDGGWVAYRHVGTTPSGLHVLVVAVNGGGSGVFKEAMWVRLVRDRVWEDGKKRDRNMLVKIGSLPLGDRDDGEVRLAGEKLFVGKSRYRAKDTLIPLE